MRRFWLLFAQATTICLAILFVITTLRPDLLSGMQRDALPGIMAVPAATVERAPGAPLQSFNDAVRKAMPAVVNIYTTQEARVPRHPFMDDPMFRYFFGDRLDAQTQRSSSLGSGVIVSDRGYVLTNAHVVEAADEIEVALADNRSAKARIVGTDPETDLAVLRIELDKLPVITFAPSEQARIGDIVLAIGNPFGVGQTVTSGIISALGRSHLGINTFENFIQTDAAINPGNSGGALIDINGALLGVNSAIYTRSGGSQGIGFAIPSNLAAQVMEQIIAHGAVTRGWVGIGVQAITPDLVEALRLPKINGALVTEVIGGGPAARGGVQPGDILVAVNDQPVSDDSSTLNLIAALQPGAAATLKVVRNGNEREIKVKVGTRPRPRPKRSDNTGNGE